MSEQKDLKNILSGLFADKGKLSKGYNQYTVEQVWRATFGSMVSSYTKAVTFNNGKLTVYITSSSLKQELVSSRENVITRMNSELKYNKVTELIIR